MSKKILVINGGSSSIKYQLLQYDNFELITSGICERIFVDGNFVNKTGENKQVIKTEMKNHDQAFTFMIDFFIKNKLIHDINEIVGVGHRIVHGGLNMKKAMIIDDAVAKEIDYCSRFAPLHNGPELQVIQSAQKIFNKALHVAVFDTSFHTTIPAINHRYAIPEEWWKKYGVQRYGAHGTSVQYVTKQMQKILNKEKVNLIVCHLGNGASVTAVKDAKSYNTSMGLTPLEGLVMGTRSGDLDPAVLNYVSLQTNKSLAEITNDLNKSSGMLGLTGMSDFRDIEDNLDNPKIKIGFDIYIKRVVDYIVRYINDLENNVDAIVFCAGVGENSPIIRKEIISKIKISNLKIDNSLNESKVNGYMLISSKDSQIPLYVVNTNEELMIAQEVKKLCN